MMPCSGSVLDCAMMQISKEQLSMKGNSLTRPKLRRTKCHKEVMCFRYGCRCQRSCLNTSLPIRHVQAVTAIWRLGNEAFTPSSSSIVNTDQYSLNFNNFHLVLISILLSFFFSILHASVDLPFVLHQVDTYLPASNIVPFFFNLAIHRCLQESLP